MNQFRKISAVAALAGSLLAAASSAVMAHHSYAPEFGKSPVSYVEGVIKEVFWTSPHVYYTLEVTGGLDTEYKELKLQSQAPTIMKNKYGVDKDFLNVGDQVAIRGRVSNYGNNGYQLISISINGAPEFALQSQGIPEIGELKEQTGNRDLSELGPDGVPDSGDE